MSKQHNQIPYTLTSSSKRGDMLYNLFYYKNKYSKKKYSQRENKYTSIYNKLVNRENITSSLRGYLFEALVEILIITKCFIGLNFLNYMKGKISETLEPETSIKNILHKKIQNGNNISDVVLQREDNTYTGISIKNYFDARNTDCENIKREFEKKNYKYQVCFITKDKQDILNHTFQSKNDDYYLVMEEIKQNNMIFDKNDIIQSNELFCDTYKDYKLSGVFLHGISFSKFVEFLDEKIFHNTRKHLIQRLHQNLTLEKFIYIMNIIINEITISNKHNRKYHLVPQVPRSGKSITLLLMAKYLIECMNMKKILIFTAVPYTIHSYIKTLNTYIDFETINYKYQKDDNCKTIDETFQGIYFCSIQYLKTKPNEKIEFLKKVSFDVMISDEAHIGSSTDKSNKNIINLEQNNGDNIINKNIDKLQQSFKLVIFASGTPGKTKQYYKIPQSQIYEWDYIDNNLMKERKYDILQKRHGELFNKVFNKSYISKNYDIYPFQILERLSFNSFLQKQIEQFNKENNTKYGFSFNALFELQQTIQKSEKNENNTNNKNNTNSKTERKCKKNNVDKIIYKEAFKLEETDDGIELLKTILHWLFNETPMAKETPIKKIQRLQTKYNSRKSTTDNPLMYIIYLPVNSKFSNIEPLQKALYNFIHNYKLWTNYFVGYTNSTSNNFNRSFQNYDDYLNTLMIETKRHEKKGCILFLGSQGTTGITYHSCDVTISLDDGKSLDLQKQKNARAMTDADGKTIGINLDMNIQRCFSLTIDMCNKFRKITQMSMNNGEIMKYMYLNKLFVFDVSNIDNYGECHESLIEKHYEMVSKEIDELYDGLNKDLPKPQVEKVLGVIEKKKEEKENVEKKVQEELQEIINKTLEVMKLWLIPFLVILSIKYKTPNVIALFDNDTVFQEIIKIMSEKKIDIKLKKKENILYIKETMKNIIKMNEEIIQIN